jgi:hypothetical protein
MNRATRPGGRWLILLVWLACACGTKPGGPEDEARLLTGRWLFDPTGSELFVPERLLASQSEQDTRVLLEGSLFGTRFERVAISPPAPEALVVQIPFARIEQAGRYELLTLALDGRLSARDRLTGQYEVRGNLATGGSLRLETGAFAAMRERTAAAGAGAAD